MVTRCKTDRWNHWLSIASYYWHFIMTHMILLNSSMKLIQWLLNYWGIGNNNLNMHCVMQGRRYFSLSLSMKWLKRGRNTWIQCNWFSILTKFWQSLSAAWRVCQNIDVYMTHSIRKSCEKICEKIWCFQNSSTPDSQPQ